MSKGIFDLAKENGIGEQPETDRRSAEEIMDLEDSERNHAEQVRTYEISIADQIREGIEPQYALMSAVKCIGLLTGDTDWTAQQTEALEKIYGDLAQQSLVNDNAAIANQRLRDQEQKYNDQLRKQVNARLKNYQKITADLNDILNQLNEAESENGALSWEASIIKDE